MPCHAARTFAKVCEAVGSLCGLLRMLVSVRFSSTFNAQVFVQTFNPALTFTMVRCIRLNIHFLKSDMLFIDNELI